MNKDNIEKFISYGLNTVQGKKEIRNLSLGIDFIFVIGFIYGIVLGGTSRIIGITMLIISLLSIVTTYIFSHKLSLKNRIIINSKISTEMVLNTLLFEFIIYAMLYGLDIFVLFLLIPPVSSFLIYFLIINKELKKDICNFKEVSKKRIKIFSMLGGIVGVFIAKSFFSNVQQRTALLLLLIFLMFISTVFSFGLINYVKLYYLGKDMEYFE